MGVEKSGAKDDVYFFSFSIFSIFISLFASMFSIWLYTNRIQTRAYFQAFVTEEFNGVIPKQYFNIVDGEIVLLIKFLDQFYEYSADNNFRASPYQSLYRIRRYGTFQSQEDLQRMIILRE